MISPEQFVKVLLKNKLEYFVGVPDSVLAEFTHYIDDIKKGVRYLISANEGSAVGLAAGYHLATKKIPLVFLQNSGLGHALNPLTSLADERVYSIPMIFLLGQRGAPNIPDEPQHKKIGPELFKILEAHKYKYFKLKKKNYVQNINKAIRLSKKRSCPVFLVVDKNFFLKTKKKTQSLKNKKIIRINYLEEIFKSKFLNNFILIGGTGFVSRELYHFSKKEKKLDQCFFNIGAMGHANQIALEIAINSKKTVIILDGDGAIQMHMGNLVSLGKFKEEKILHIIFNNYVHESTGGQSVANDKINYKSILKACGYKVIKDISNLNQFKKEINKPIKKLTALIIKINSGTIENLPRPKETLKYLKIKLQKKLI